MQTTNNILLVKPANFGFNSETEASNAFQGHTTYTKEVILQKVEDEFNAFVTKLTNYGVNVFVFDDTATPIKPDAIFPNNWVSFHADGRVVLYPMQAKNRQLEKRHDIIEELSKSFKISTITNLSSHESSNEFLEGTGSIIFDHTNKKAYACLSPRTHKDLFINFCKDLGYEAIYFYSVDANGKEIYHTNVMMCIGEQFVIICTESITNSTEKELVMNSFTNTGHEIIDISFEQVKQFAGNMLQLHTNSGKKILVLSQSAFDSLTDTQKLNIEKYCELSPMNIKTIETIGGGSARCMIAEIFCDPL